MTETPIQRAASRIVNDAAPLSDDQKRRLRALFGTGPMPEDVPPITKIHRGSRKRGRGDGGRPPRRVPGLSRIADFHGLGSKPRCIRCGNANKSTSWSSARGLDRAHIIDRWSGGLDDVQNIAPICPNCHREQPIFTPGQEIEALRWFRLPANSCLPGKLWLNKMNEVATKLTR